MTYMKHIDYQWPFISVHPDPLWLVLFTLCSKRLVSTDLCCGSSLDLGNWRYYHEIGGQCLFIRK